MAMAVATSGEDLVSRAKKFREGAAVQHQSVTNVQERLAAWRKFLQDHETSSPNDNTHDVFDSYNDWWMGDHPKYKLSIAEDNTVAKLYNCISELYDLGIPLTLTEKRTPQIRFVQDVEVWGTKEAALGVQELLDPQGRFVHVLGSTLGDIYDKMPFLDMVVFDATGVSRTKGVMKTSIKLVWPNIIVDKERAAKIRDYVVHKFKSSGDEDLRSLSSKMLEHNKDNQWNFIFSDTIYMNRCGVRMPLCDRVSPAPLKRPERRPFKPVGVLRFEFEGGALNTVERICEADGLDGPDWLKLGCIRQPAGSPLTEWRLPSWNGERMPRTNTSASTATATAMSNRAPGHVRVRTNRGSGESYRSRRPGGGTSGPSQPEVPMTLEREFKGTKDTFQEKLVETIGEGQIQECEVVENTEGIFSWCFPNGLRIDFKVSTGRVYVIGKAHQVRSILSAIAPAVQPIGESARSATTARSAASRGGSEYGGQSAFHAPSAVYAPSFHSQVPSQVYAGSTASTSRSAVGGGGLVETKRVVVREFQSESSTELALAVHDVVTVQHDPEDGHNAHRWVYGLNEASQKVGWFPMWCTKALQLPAESESLPDMTPQ